MSLDIHGRKLHPDWLMEAYNYKALILVKHAAQLQGMMKHVCPYGGLRYN